MNRSLAASAFALVFIASGCLKAFERGPFDPKGEGGAFPNGLQALYYFNGTYEDEVKRNVLGFIGPVMQFADGRIAQGLERGTGESADIVTTHGVNLQNDVLTVEFWLKVKAMPPAVTDPIILFKDSLGPPSEFLYIEVDGMAPNKLRVNKSAPAGGFVEKLYGGGFPTNTWIHVAVVYKPPGKGDEVILYVDGAKVGMLPLAGGFTLPFQPMLIGNDAATATVFVIDALKYWSVVRSQSQIQASMNGAL